jgi:predicted RNA-binding protein with PUA-like domain
VNPAPPAVSIAPPPPSVAHWLVKQEPSAYSYSDLERERRTRWDGVHNAAALLHIRSMRPGDEALFYHTGEERSCIGILRVASAPHPDADDARTSWWVEVAPVRRLARPVTLAEIRGDPAFEGWELLRISRLSVVPVPDPLWARILALSKRPRPGAPTEVPKSRARAPGRASRRTSARRTR